MTIRDLLHAATNFRELSRNTARTLHNATLSTFGVSDRIGIHGPIGAVTLTVGKVLTKEMEGVAMREIQAGLDKFLSDLGIRVGSPRCQSGNAQQSVE